MKTSFSPSEERLLSRLRERPRLCERIERLMEIVEDPADELRRAEEAERRVIEEVRGLGRELVEGWAEGQVEKRAQELEQQPGVWREGKKNSAGIPSLGTSKSRSRSTGKGRGGDGR
jgi:hypothetical protein